MMYAIDNIRVEQVLQPFTTVAEIIILDTIPKRAKLTML